MALVLERRIPPGSAALWRRCAAGFGDDGPREDARSRHSIAFKLSVFSGIALLGAFWGSAVAAAGFKALYLLGLLLGCAFILRDFLIAWVLLIPFVSISRSYVIPPAILGVTGVY